MSTCAAKFQSNTPDQHKLRHAGLAAILLLGLAAPVLAQTDTTEPAGQLPTFFAGNTETPALQTECIAAGYQPKGQTVMRLKLTVLPDGTLQGLPELMEPAAPSSDVRVDYLGLVTATESCAPLDWAPAGEYLLSVDATGALGAEPIAAAAAATAIIPVAPAPAPAPASPQTGTEPAFPTFLATPEAAPAPEAAQPPVAALPTFLAPTVLAPSSPDTEALMTLDRQAIRDVQARLLVSGFDPNGVDGVLGNGARAALSSWQETVGTAPTGYLSTDQLQALQTQSQAQLDIWLQEPGNAAQYTPPQRAQQTTRSTTRKKRRVRVCKRNALGILYDCRNVLR